MHRFLLLRSEPSKASPNQLPHSDDFSPCENDECDGMNTSTRTVPNRFNFSPPRDAHLSSSNFDEVDGPSIVPPTPATRPNTRPVSAFMGDQTMADDISDEADSDLQQTTTEIGMYFF